MPIRPKITTKPSIVILGPSRSKKTLPSTPIEPFATSIWEGIWNVLEIAIMLFDSILRSARFGRKNIRLVSIYSSLMKLLRLLRPMHPLRKTLELTTNLKKSNLWSPTMIDMLLLKGQMMSMKHFLASTTWSIRSQAAKTSRWKKFSVLLRLARLRKPVNFWELWLLKILLSFSISKELLNSTMAIVIKLRKS